MANKEKRNGNCKLTIEEENELCQDYINGMGSTMLSRKYNINPASVCRILDIYNVKKRTLKEARNNFLQRALDENFFENIDTPQKAYWLGVMYSDGYISETNKYTNYFGISVKVEDIKWLEKFKSDLKYNGEIKIYTQTCGYGVGMKYARLLIGSNKIVEDLKKLGVIPHKTQENLHIPDIPYKDDFVRGLIDGDGSLRQSAPDVRLCGCKTLMIDVGEYLGLPYKLYQDKNIWGLYFSRNNSRILEKRLYENAKTYLDRKYELAKRSFNSPINQE